MNSKLSLCTAALFFLTVGCGGGGGDSHTADKPADNAAASHDAAPAAVDPATAATVSGTISFEGDVPKAEKINMSADPTCAAMHSEPMYTQSTVVNDGKLQWVFVYVKSGLEGKSFPTPSTPAVMDQHGCKYEPHVLGVMVNQPLEILNSDETLHNIHAMPTANKAFNIGMPLKDMKQQKTFDQPEVMIPVKCDVHSWMISYIGVLPHPCFAVSSATGSYTISGLPPGTYTLEAWHETLGAQTMEVTVGPSETKTADFTFKATS